MNKYKVRRDGAFEGSVIEALDPKSAAIAFLAADQREWGVDDDDEGQASDDVEVETPEGVLLHFRVDTHVRITHSAVPIVMEPDLEPEDLDGEDGDL